MVGAKEFATKRKVIVEKKNSPLLDRISMPIWMKSHEDATKAESGSFLDGLKLRSNTREDKHKVPVLHKEHDSRTKNPIIAAFDKHLATMPKPSVSEALAAFNRHIATRQHLASKPRVYAAKAPEKVEEVQEDTANSFSEDLANQITYKVFKNIKSYLDSDYKKATTNNSAKHIKLEICL
jgi:hypothetical protein